MKKPVVLLVALQDEFHVSLNAPHIHVVYTGVGKINATLTTVETIHRLSPELIINFGSAGNVSNCTQGLVEVSKVIQRDMNAEPLAPRGHTPYHAGPHVLESGQQGVICATGDSFVTAHDPWFTRQGVDVVDMELYAIAHVCTQKGMPWRSLKFISDNANDDSSKDWQANVKKGQGLMVNWLQAQKFQS
ncbi:MAG: 5'-methylthioadenosine nucleosidase [Betaproteobacteria bacterium]|nr:5'-methylthioadenosine nucleosidase [Betaproteobacteria bacterium]